MLVLLYVIFIEQFGLDDLRDVILKKLPKPSLGDNKFQFSTSEFEKHLPFQTIELDTGAIMTAPIEDFDKCFTHRKLEKDKHHYEAEGWIINKRLRKSK